MSKERTAALIAWGRPLAALAAIIAGFAATDARVAIWTAALLVVGGSVVARTTVGIARGQFASDIVAALAILGALAFGQPLAGLIVTLMQTGGEGLEHWAERRASAAVRALEDSAPRVAHRVREGGTDDITVDQIVVGDRCLVRPGEMIPCDGVIDEGHGEIDFARITGEPIPVPAAPGDAVRSGGVVIARPLVIRATARAGESLYARIVELVREAQAAKAPLQRLADRWAVWFTPFTLLACAATYAVTRDPTRVLAVLVCATPCPLILAAPVAIIGGINRMARARVVVRTGGALERLADIDVVALDKTGTLTVGHPEVKEVRASAAANADVLLAMAASLEHSSGHPLAQSVVTAANERHLTLSVATNVREDPGRGVRGEVGGRQVAVGSPRWAREHCDDTLTLDNLPPASPSETLAIVLLDHRYAGAIVFADALRPGLKEFFAELGAMGVGRTLLLSGDRPDRVANVAAELGVKEARGDLLPEGKVDAIRALVAEGHRVAMIGDGVNDAPALAAATVGVALAAHGGGIAAESAECVLLADDLRLVAKAMAIARRTLVIARQSIGVGIGLSLVAMGLAAVGALSPVAGAMVQEVIDVAVILNAIRAAGGPSRA